MNKIKKIICSPRLPFALFLICILLAAAAYAWQRIYTSDFKPINGDFQNYNAFRRVLGGQIPYQDFANYLGVGILVTNVPFLAFFNNFTASLLITNVTTYLIFCASVALLSYLVSRNKTVSLFFGAALPVAYFHILNRVPSLLQSFDFINLCKPGNSMRMHRAFLPFLLAFFFLFVLRSIKKSDKSILMLITGRKTVSIFGLVIGACIVWSNDYGFACVASSFFILSLLLAKNSKAVGKTAFFSMLLFLAGTMAGFLFSLLVVTRGHILSYFTFTKGVSDDQFWYYGDTKLLKLSDIWANSDYRLSFILFAILTIEFLVRLAIDKHDNNSILAFFILFTSFLASLIYIYGSGGFAFEALRLCIFVILLANLMKLLEFLLRATRFRIVTQGVFTLFLCVLLLYSSYTGYDTMKNYRRNTQPSTSYVAGLRGYTHYAEGLKKEVELLGGGEIFSTYASAYEAITGQYQPSGTDYIIHVLGDKQRQEYLDCFQKGNYGYVATIRNDISNYEGWVKRANWFFYRELFANYVPVASTDYNILWEKYGFRNTIEAGYTINIKKINEYSAEILVTSTNLDHITADVSIEYDSSFQMNFSRLSAFRRIVSVDDPTCRPEALTGGGLRGYGIPNQADTYNIHITLENGKGSVVISSKPGDCTVLNLKTAKLNFFVPTFTGELLDLCKE